LIIIAKRSKRTFLMSLPSFTQFLHPIYYNLVWSYLNATSNLYNPPPKQTILMTTFFKKKHRSALLKKNHTESTQCYYPTTITNVYKCSMWWCYLSELDILSRLLLHKKWKKKNYNIHGNDNGLFSKMINRSSTPTTYYAIT